MKKGPLLIKEARGSGEYPSHSLQEVALVGRSNVGKSSLINTLIRRKGFAAISSSPGKTRSIHFYRLNKGVALVDLPGYGFAKVPRKVKESWAAMIEEYLYSRENLTAVIHILDVRHSPSQEDRMMWDWITGMNIPVLIVATKVDKIGRGQRSKQREMLKKSLQIQGEIPLLLFSATTGEGREELFRFISSLEGR